MNSTAISSDDVIGVLAHVVHHYPAAGAGGIAHRLADELGVGVQVRSKVLREESIDNGIRTGGLRRVAEAVGVGGSGAGAEPVDYPNGFTTARYL